MPFSIVFMISLFPVPPTVLVKPNSIVINASESVAVRCTGSGFPLPKVNWNVTDLKSSVTLKVKTTLFRTIILIGTWLTIYQKYGFDVE